MAANSGAMAANEERDSSEDWLLPETTRARSFSQLESRVHVALTLAQASEAAVREVGAAAIEAAEQARQAAELAEQAAVAAQAARESVALAPAPAPIPASVPVAPAADNPAVYPLPGDEDLRLAHFMERADRVVARLRILQLS